MKYLLLLLAGLSLPTALAQTTARVKTKIKQAPKPRPFCGGALGFDPPSPRYTPPPAADYATLYAERFITQDKLRRDLSVLASDEYEGRETGTKGQKMAAAYISQQFRADSLVAPVGTTKENVYLQTFTLERSAWRPGGTLTVGGKTYKWLEDFYAFGRSPFQQATAVQPVFVGYGIEQGAYSDYKGLDVKGRDLVVLLGEPRTPEGSPVLSTDGSATKWGVDFRAKAALASQKGARSVFFIDASPNANFAKLAGRLAPRVMQPIIAATKAGGGRAPSFFVSPDMGYQLLGTTESKLKEFEAQKAQEAAMVMRLKEPYAVDRPLHAKPAFKPRKFTITAPQDRSAVSTENVLGFLPGTDKKDEILVVSAHYDHLGIIGGKVFNGADDDGSGTVGMLAIAEAFAKAAHAGHGPRRSILFLANTGEEKGLLGSQYYAEHPVFPLASTITDLNIDMIGRTDAAHEGKPDYVYVIGSDKLSSELHAVLEDANRRHGNLALDYRYNDPNDPNRFYYRSDHYNFAVHKIPVAFFFNGVHADYHEETDEVSKIEFDKLEARARLVFYTAWELANRDARPVVDSNKQ